MTLQQVTDLAAEGDEFDALLALSSPEDWPRSDQTINDIIQLLYYGGALVPTSAADEVAVSALTAGAFIGMSRSMPVLVLMFEEKN